MTNENETNSGVRNKMPSEEQKEITDELNKILQEEIDREFLSEVRRVMPKIMVGDDFVGVSPFKGPTEETITEMSRKYNKSKDIS